MFTDRVDEGEGAGGMQGKPAIYSSDFFI